MFRRRIFSNEEIISEHPINCRNWAFPVEALREAVTIGNDADGCWELERSRLFLGLEV